jgi:transposase-like protein
MAHLEVSCQNNMYHIRSQEFCLHFKKTPANKKVLWVFLRALRSSKDSKPFFTHEQIAQAFGYTHRQNTQNFEQELHKCDDDLLAYLQHKRKVDDAVVQAVQEAVRKRPLAPATHFLKEVVVELERPDLTAENIRTALQQVPCTVIRPVLQRQWEAGRFHPKEEVVLQEALAAVLSSQPCAGRTVSDELKRLGVEPIEAMEAQVIQRQHHAAIAVLLSPRAKVAWVSDKIQVMVLALTLYFWNVPLSRIALWLGVSKSSVYQWVMGLAVALFPIIQAWIVLRVKAARVAIDEKWLKIRTQWHYWFVTLDETTALPLCMAFLPTRTKWACCWMLVTLKHLGKTPRAVITDGLSGYAASLPMVFPRAKHLLCLFHHQQGVTRWLREHAGSLTQDRLRALKRKMKRVVQTADPRTLRRRVTQLETDTTAQQCGIDTWIARMHGRLDHLIPALRRNAYPRTTNGIERFFRAFQRFYKTRGGFHSVLSAKRELMLFVVMYVFTVQVGTGMAPIEQIVPQAKQMPFYKLVNDPFGSGLLANMCQAKSREAKNMATREVALALKSP